MASKQTLEWTELDRRAVDVVRALAMDAVQKAGNGHPGTAMSLAPAAYLLFQKLLRHDPTDPDWLGRDRFVLSCGHSSLTLYIQLYLSGYGLTLDDLEHLRQWGCLTPGPPRARPHPRRRDHHRPAGPGRRQRGRHGDGRPPRARAARPRRRARREPVRPHTSGASPPTATSRRASPARRPRSPAPAARQPRRCSTTTTTSRSRTTPTSPSPRTSSRATRAYGWHVQHVDWLQPTARTTRTSRRCTTPSTPRGRRPTGRRSSRCARSSPGRRPTSRTPARRTARRSAPTRSPPPRRSWASTPTKTFDVADEVLDHARKVVDRGRRCARRVADGVRRLGGRPTPSAPRCSTGMRDRRAARRLGRRAADLRRRRQGHRHPQGVRRGAQRHRRRAARAVGRLGRPRRVQQHHARGRAVVPARATGRPRSSRAAPTAARCTSASASTPWARS